MKNVFLSGPNGSYEDLSLLSDALEAEGIGVWRPDRLMAGTGNDWSGEIQSAIKRCDVFVGVLYKANPNVMFELGYALGGGMSVLLIRCKGGDIPFDVASLPMLAIDRFNSRSILEAVAWIKKATVRARPPTPDFQDAQEKLQHMCDDESFLDEVKPRDFEDCIVNVLLEKGFCAEQTSDRYDKGFDAEIRDFAPNVKAVVEARKLNRNRRLSISEVQRVVGAAVTARAQCAIIVTSGEFTASARYCAGESPIPVALLTIDEFAGMTRDDLIKQCN